MVNCNIQQDVDEYWEKLSAEGGGQKIQCGCLKDKYGISWQVMPIVLLEMISHPILKNLNKCDGGNASNGGN